ncbi:hypothetical protein F4778DRAFT_722836 [Xylariomycetidae sp. FL2044]|nr:hypothetical protein F4778DRAFT_722836 [Xylariomycetidae sp. FL2044]
MNEPPPPPIYSYPDTVSTYLGTYLGMYALGNKDWVILKQHIGYRLAWTLGAQVRKDIVNSMTSVRALFPYLYICMYFVFFPLFLPNSRSCIFWSYILLLDSDEQTA